MKKTGMIAMILMLAAAGAKAADLADLQSLKASDIAAKASAFDVLPIPQAQSAAKVLLQAKAVQLQVEQNSVNLADYKARLVVNCMYRSGLWPQPHVCGSRTVPVEIDGAGRLLIPAIESFDGVQGAKLDNFDVAVYVNSKADNTMLFALSMQGKAALASYAADNTPVNLLKMNDAVVDVLVEGKPLAGSELAADPDAMLMNQFVEDRDILTPGMALVSSVDNTQSFDNYPHSYAKPSLAGFKALSLKGGVLARKAGPDRKLELVTTLTLHNIPSQMQRWQSRIEISRTVDGLEKIGAVDMLKVK
ncbi:MAG: hypothetical protein M0011_03855 [Elusimicrobia bacterium]|nr:hypothetical protein [Elusimicrobiota bacterium]